MALFTAAATTAGLFLFNLLCALAPCNMVLDLPEISNYETNSLKREKSTTTRISKQARDLKFDENNDIYTPAGENGEFDRVEYPIVQTNAGSLRGYTMKVANGRKIWAFEGIPFGESTGGRYRFRAPAPKARWSGVRNAFKPGDYCAQMHLVRMLMVTGSEDCLFLNVYTPNIPQDNFQNRKLPVLVQIHGGSFIFGAGHEYGQGLLGFFSTGDSASPGNYGLKDQALALKWIHENIEAFGGDNQKVTIMGQSGGAVSTHLHMISNVTRDYYQRAISLSGTAFVHWGVQSQDRTRRFTEKVARKLRCPLEPSDALVECLRNKNFARLAAVQMDLLEWVPFPLIMYGPSVESPDDPEAFLTETPEEAYDRGNVAKKPWIVSIMAGEGYVANYIFTLMSRYWAIKNHPDIFLPIVLDLEYMNLSSEELGQVLSVIKQLYFGTQDMRRLKNSDIGHEIGTDRYFAYGIEKAIKAHSKVGPTFPYQLSYLSQYNIGTLLGLTKEEQGICHGEDMFFYFNSSYYSKGFQHSDPEYKLSQIMINLLKNFMDNGEPLYTDDSGRNIKIWDSISDPEKIRYLDLKNDIKMIDSPFTERIKVWTSLGLPDTQPLLQGFRNEISKYNDLITKLPKLKPEEKFTLIESN